MADEVGSPELGGDSQGGGVGHGGLTPGLAGAWEAVERWRHRGGVGHWGLTLGLARGVERGEGGAGEEW
jgi:hypothetical protein